MLDAIPNYCATSLEPITLLKPMTPLGLSYPSIEVAVVGGVDAGKVALGSPPPSVQALWPASAVEEAALLATRYGPPFRVE